MGRIKYIPKNLLNELDDLKAEKQIKKDSQAFNELAKYARVGREAERLYTLDFRWKPTKWKKKG